MVRLEAVNRLHEKDMPELKIIEIEKKSKIEEEKRKCVEIVDMSKRALKTHKWNLRYSFHTKKSIEK